MSVEGVSSLNKRVFSRWRQDRRCGHVTDSWWQSVPSPRRGNLGRSALYCGLRYMFDIGCLLSPKFSHSNVVWNYYLSTISSEQLAKVDILKDMLLFRDNPNRYGLFVNGEISTAINCTCTEWLSDSPIFYVLLLLYHHHHHCHHYHHFANVRIFFYLFMLYFVYDLNNNNNNRTLVSVYWRSLY